MKPATGPPLGSPGGLHIHHGDIIRLHPAKPQDQIPAAGLDKTLEPIHTLHRVIDDTIGF